MNNTKLAEEIAQIILSDIADRRGLGDEWDSFDANIKEEIVATWVDLIKKRLDKAD